GLGYIRISQFQERTATDVAQAIEDLNAKKHVKGIVLDLRNNPGGLLNAAIGVSAAFLPKDELVVSTRGRNAEDERKFSASLRDYATGKGYKDNIATLPAVAKTVPVVVLINSASASASEIVAGALQDHKRAVIMGTRSFGKGSVQTIMPLRMHKDETTGIKITTARYYTPSGRTIQAKGITPDIAVDDTPEGNYPSFTVREADLAHHIEVDDKDAKGKKTDKKSQADDFDAMSDEEVKMPTLRYLFGDEKDFPLQQAQAQLLGKKVITHEETQAKLKAQREKEKAEKAKANKAQNKQSEDKK
ncbi:MAG: S41 family peptidase, partial [Sutterellaceae bacterium]|nr:S41 family peptidase [Sutterellaceae bacterium]